VSTPLASHLRVALDPGLPPALVGAGTRAQLEELTAVLPAALTDFFGLEVRLGEEEPRADFLLCMRVESGGREALASALGPGGALAGLADREPVWRRLADFAAAWTEDPRLREDVDNVWLEFDLPPGSPPLPSIFFGLAHGRRDDAPRALPVLRAALGALLGDAPAEAAAPALAHVVGCLPPGAGIFQVGAMLARPDRGLRLCVRGLHDGAALGAFLREAGWTGDVDRLVATAISALAACDTIDLDLDLAPGGTLGPVAGLECAWVGDASARPRHDAFLGALVAQGLCVPAKRDAHAGWWRATHAGQFPGAWPEDLQRALAAEPPGSASLFLRWPYHVKLVCPGGALSSAKSYLAVRHVMADRARLRRMAGGPEE
jgi:hypothetical protein